MNTNVDKLMAQWEPALWHIARRVMKHNASGDDLEDVVAEMRYMLLRLARRYDPSRGVSFAAYAYRRLQFHCRDYYWRALARGIRVWSRRALSIRVRSLLPSDEMVAKHSHIDTDLDVWAIISRYVTPREEEVLRLRFIDGLTYRQIAEKIHRTHGYVCQVIKSAIQKLRENPEVIQRFLMGEG